MQRSNLVSLRRHLLRDPIRRMSMLTKDDTLSNSKEGVERRKNLIFVFFIFTVHIELPDGINTEFFLLQFNLVCVWREFGSE